MVTEAADGQCKCFLINTTAVCGRSSSLKTAVAVYAQQRQDALQGSLRSCKSRLECSQTRVSRAQPDPPCFNDSLFDDTRCQGNRCLHVLLSASSLCDSLPLWVCRLSCHQSSATRTLLGPLQPCTPLHHPHICQQSEGSCKQDAIVPMTTLAAEDAIQQVT